MIIEIQLSTLLCVCEGGSLIFIKSNFLFHFSSSCSRLIAFPKRRTNSTKKTKTHTTKKRRVNSVRCLAATTVSRFVMYVQTYTKCQYVIVTLQSIWNEQFLRKFVAGLDIKQLSHSWLRCCLFGHRSLFHSITCLILLSFSLVFDNAGTFHQRQWRKRIGLFNCRWCR